MLPYLDIPFERASRLIGASPDELKLVFSFLFSYPLAGLLKRIPDGRPELKNLFIIAISLFYLVGLFDLWDGLATLLLSSFGTYAIASQISGPYMPWIAFVFLMVHLSLNHLYRQITDDPSVIDITGAQMVLVMKLSSFCWNVHDGRLPKKELAEYQAARAIQQLPSLLDFSGFVFFFPALLVGPSFEYTDYQRWIETSLFEIPPGTDPAHAPPVRKKRKIPRSGTPALIKAAKGIAWIFLFLKLNPWYNQDLVLGDTFMDYSFLRRIWFLEMLGLTTRFKYYGVWSLTEGACILSGMGYKGIDPKSGRVQWDKLRNVNPWGIESAQNSRAYLENWNINTNNWLRNCIYLRVTPKGKKPGFRASLATFVTSAFWHGFYPGYYLTFILAAFVQTAAKNFRRYVRPFFLTPDGTQPTKWKPYYDIASYFATQAIFCFTTVPFVVLTLPKSIKVWSRVYFYAIAAVGISLTFFASPAKPYLISQLKSRQGVGKDRLQRKPSQDSIGHPLLGLPSDPGREIDEAVQEVKEEIELRRRRGSAVEGVDVQAEVIRKLETRSGWK